MSKPIDIKPYEATVTILEEMLANAKSGKLQEVVVVGIMDDGGIGSAYSPTVNFIKRIGALEHVRFRWMHDDIHSQDGA